MTPFFICLSALILAVPALVFGSAALAVALVVAKVAFLIALPVMIAFIIIKYSFKFFFKLLFLLIGFVVASAVVGFLISIFFNLAILSLALMVPLAGFALVAGGIVFIGYVIASLFRKTSPKKEEKVIEIEI